MAINIEHVYNETMVFLSSATIWRIKWEFIKNENYIYINKTKEGHPTHRFKKNITG